MLLQIRGEITPERMNGWNQSNTSLFVVDGGLDVAAAFALGKGRWPVIGN